MPPNRVGSFATQARLRFTATQSEVAATGVDLDRGDAGNLAAGSAFLWRPQRAPRRRLPAVLCASGRALRGSRLWVAVKRVTQSEVAATGIALAAIGLSVTITTATGCSQKATGPEQDKTASAEMPVTPSNISRDEEVVFFPTCAHSDDDGKTWTVPVHGIIYEPEADSRKRHAMVRALARTLQVEEGTEEAENLDRRLRLFLVDNQRDKSLSVRIGGKVYDVGTSGPNGHFQGTLRFSAVEMEHVVGSQATDNSFLSFEAVTRKSDDRSFTGRVQRVGPTGLSIISDIDDTIKHSQIGDRKAVLVNTFLRRFNPVPDMPELYRDWAQKGMVFHYVSGSPWQLYLPLVEFIRTEGLPPGSFDLKYFRLKDSSAFGLLQSQQATKRRAIGPLMRAFPKRRFILIGDSGEQDPEIYAQVARDYSAQVVAIFIRNVTGESIDSARFQMLQKGLDDVCFRLFDRPEELRPVVEEVTVH